MANSATRSAWQQIQAGVYDTEKLLTNQEYNLSMIKARQTLEVIIKQLSGREDEEDQSLADIIDSLYTNNIISKTSCEHYHKIRAIGNKAVHENNDDGYNATIAYQLLSEEVQTFIHDYSPKKTRISPVITPVRNDNTQRRQNVSATESTPKRKVVRKTSKNKKRPTVNTSDLAKVAVGFVILLILIFLFRSLNPFKNDKKTTTTTTTTAATYGESSDSSETNSETSTEAAAAASTKYVTTAKLNVRSAPSRDGDILATLNVGVTVDYAGEHDSTWSIINYNGGQAYVATAYIKPAQ